MSTVGTIFSNPFRQASSYRRSLVASTLSARAERMSCGTKKVGKDRIALPLLPRHRPRQHTWQRWREDGHRRTNDETPRRAASWANLRDNRAGLAGDGRRVRTVKEAPYVPYHAAGDCNLTPTPLA